VPLHEAQVSDKRRLPVRPPARRPHGSGTPNPLRRWPPPPERSRSPRLVQGPFSPPPLGHGQGRPALGGDRARTGPRLGRRLDVDVDLGGVRSRSGRRESRRPAPGTSRPRSWATSSGPCRIRTWLSVRPRGSRCAGEEDESALLKVPARCRFERYVSPARADFHRRFSGRPGPLPLEVAARGKAPFGDCPSAEARPPPRKKPLETLAHVARLVEKVPFPSIIDCGPSRRRPES